MSHNNKLFKSMAQAILNDLPIGKTFTSNEFLNMIYIRYPRNNNLHLSAYRVSGWLKAQPNLNIERFTHKPYTYTKVSE